MKPEAIAYENNASRKEIKVESKGREPSGTDTPVSAPAIRANAAVAADPAAVYLSQLAPSGRRTMRRALDTIAGLASGGRADASTLPWAGWRSPNTQALRAHLVERYAPASVNKHLSALRGVLEACFDLGLMSADEHRRAAKVRRVPNHRLPAGRGLSAEELRALFAACADGRPGGTRDAALLATLYGCGLRRSEAVSLDLADVDVATGEVRVRRGKGDRDRVVWATGGTLAAIQAWLAVRGGEPGPLFVPVDKAGSLTIRRLSGQAILHICRRRAAQAGVGDFSPHDLRRTYISDLLDAGADIATVQQLAGHASVTTTASYDRRPEQVRRTASGLLDVPFDCQPPSPLTSSCQITGAKDRFLLDDT